MDKIIQALIRSAAFGFIGIAMGAPASRIADAAEYTLMPSPRTVNIGNFDAANKPVLTINSGDIVTLEAATQIEPEAVDASGAVPRAAVPQYVRDIRPCTESPRTWRKSLLMWPYVPSWNEEPMW